MLSINEHQKICLAVLDGAKAQLYDVTLSPMKVTPRPDGHYSGNRKMSHHMASDAPGRGFESSTGSHHSMTPPSDPHDHAEDVFVSNIAHDLSVAAAGKKFDKLIIVAPARARGVLRKKLTKDVSGVLEKEITQDWTNIPQSEIAAHLAKHLSPA